MKLPWFVIVMSLGLSLAGYAALGEPELFSASAPHVAAADAGAVASAPSAETAADGSSASDSALVGDIVVAARAGRWLVVLGGVLSLIVAALKTLAKAGGVAWFHTDRGGAALVGMTSLLGALATTAMSGARLDWATFGGALAVTWAAAGGYTWLRKLVWPAR